MNANNQTHLKLSNQKVILDYIIKNGGTSRAELSKRLGSSKPTISTNVNYLIEEKILIEDGFDSNLVGKKAVMLHLNKDLHYILVCDFISEIFSQTLNVSLSNLKYEAIFTEKITISLDLSSENLNNILNIDIINILNNYDINIGKISKVILALPGVVNALDLSIKDFQGTTISLSNVCNKIFKDKVILINDIKLMTLSENYFGEGKHFDNFSFIWAGIALNSGIIINNQLYNGKNNASGEIGLILVTSPFTHKQCYLGEIASINGLLSNVMFDKKMPVTSSLYDYRTKGTLNFSNVIDGVLQKDPYCIKICELIGTELGKVIYNLTLILDLEGVILGGELTALGDALIAHIQNFLDLNPLTSPKLRIAKTSNSIILGGYKLGVDSTLQSLIK